MADVFRLVQWMASHVAGRNHSSERRATRIRLGQAIRQCKVIRDIESTPLVIDGTIFTVPDAEHVVALDAKTGAGDLGIQAGLCRPISACRIDFGPVNRGLAALRQRPLFRQSWTGTWSRSMRTTEEVIWQTLVANPSEGYSITGAPLVVNHSVMVGMTGGEFRTRGFLAAYDVSTGQQQWKFNTIPGPGEIGHETWENDAWRKGGGATWITGSYDPSTDLLYWGVGNPSPELSTATCGQAITCSPTA